MAELSTLGAVIKQAYEKQSNTNAFTDAAKQAVNNLKAVATSGDYADLSNKPDIPTNNNQLTNGADYVTSSNASVPSLIHLSASANVPSGTPAGTVIVRDQA